MNGNPIAYSTHNGVLHLYSDPEEFRAVMRSDNYMCAGWITSVVVHEKTVAEQWKEAVDKGNEACKG